MKRPMARGAAIDMRRMADWTRDFTGYRITITEDRIDRWLAQFRHRDRDLAARTLDCVDFVTHEQIAASFRQILGMLPGWNIDENLRQGRWRFVAYSGSAGESGDTMLHRFRLANNLTGRRFNELFIYRSELPSGNFGPDDTVVFVDDFSGTGNQVCTAWPLIRELVPVGPRLFLILIAACAAAVDRIEHETDLQVVPYITLAERDNLFSSRCTYFTQIEKDRLVQYGLKGDPNHPRGWGDSGLVLVFAHNCPNDTIPVLHARRRGWEGLFRRQD